MFPCKQASKQNYKNKIKQEFRLFLQDELTNRCQHNPNYSLRSFARHLEISPSALSAMLTGKRPITHSMKERIGLKLGLELTTLEKLKSKPHGNSKRKKDGVDQLGFQQITIDTFAIISDPCHYALLELIKTESFKWEPAWMARRLKITTSEVTIAVERLERVGLLKRDEEGRLFDSTEGFSTDLRDGLSTQAQIRYQQRSLRLAADELNTVPVHLRDNTSMTMAVNVEDIPKAKQLIKEFRRQFCQKMEAHTVLNEVYQLTISFIPLTQTNGEKK